MSEISRRVNGPSRCEWYGSIPNGHEGLVEPYSYDPVRVIWLCECHFKQWIPRTNQGGHVMAKIEEPDYSILMVHES